MMGNYGASMQLKLFLFLLAFYFSFSTAVSAAAVAQYVGRDICTDCHAPYQTAMKLYMQFVADCAPLRVGWV